MPKEKVVFKERAPRKAGRVTHIAYTMYPVKDIVRARRFYEDVLGLELTKNYREEWIEYHLSNGCFAITSMIPHLSPSADSGGSIAFEVDDVDSFVDRLRARDIPIKVEPFSTPVCRAAVVLDPEGNAVCLHAKKSGRDA